MGKAKIFKVMENCKKMPYYKNDAASGGEDYNKHEDAVEDTLKSAGFKKSDTKKVSKEQKNVLMKNGHRDIEGLMGEGEYISQPCGTHDRPDFMVKEDGIIYFIECKSSKGQKPVYNSGLPCSHCIYIFCSLSTNKTAIYMGSSVAGQETVRLMAKAQEKIDKILKPINEQLGKTEDNRGGLVYYDRAMYNHQKTGSEFREEYFEPTVRDSRYSNVIEYISAL